MVLMNGSKSVPMVQAQLSSKIHCNIVVAQPHNRQSVKQTASELLPGHPWHQPKILLFRKVAGTSVFVAVKLL